MIIGTYNVEFLFDIGEHEHSGEKWVYTSEYVEARVNRLAEKFKEANADVLLLQEVGSQSAVQKIIEKSGIAYSAYYADPDRFGVGNTVLYRVPALQLESITTTAELPVFVEGETDTLSPHIKSRRSFVHITVDYQGKPLHIIGQHIKANFLVDMAGRGDNEELTNTQVSAADGLIRSEMVRMSQAKRLRQKIDELLAADSQAQIIVGGDFNATTHDTVYRIAEGVVANRADQLHSAMSLSDIQARYESEPSGESDLIDDLLYSHSLVTKVDNVRVLSKSVRPHKEIPPYRQYIDSDHAPIVIEII